MPSVPKCLRAMTDASPEANRSRLNIAYLVNKVSQIVASR
jgi:hypothetical protein